jgi:aminoglycoside/choline kinase family phosphotransferase
VALVFNFSKILNFRKVLLYICTMHEEILKELFKQYFNEDCTTIIQLPQAGSDRIYFRLMSTANAAIGTYGKDTKENETFIHHTKHFHQKFITVPQIYCASENKQYYLQQDLGDTSLYSIIKSEGITENVKKTLERSIAAIGLFANSRCRTF